MLEKIKDDIWTKRCNDEASFFVETGPLIYTPNGPRFFWGAKKYRINKKIHSRLKAFDTLYSRAIFFLIIASWLIPSKLKGIYYYLCLILFFLIHGCLLAFLDSMYVKKQIKKYNINQKFD